VAGLAISQHWRVAAGATIVLVAAGLFAVSLVAAPRHGLLARLRSRRHRGEAAPRTPERAAATPATR
jgi:hypothetical protein